MSDQANDLLAAESQVRAATVVEVDTDRGIIDALIVTYEQRAQIDHDLFEVFSRGAFASSVAAPHRVKVSNQQHDMRVAIGRATEIREESDGLYGRLHIADTAAGRDVLTLLREEIIDELSIEFVPQKRYMKVEKMADGGLLVRHDRAVLKGISPVSHGAYGRGSRVLAVRAQSIFDERSAEREQAAQAAAADLTARREAELQRLRALSA
ncbi:MAG: HK97 family phage prohead protease [Intrasporangiaceae bacterium]|nr:HK97 family phage prohead protease [Intrasporangiaceae bacterium]